MFHVPRNGYDFVMASHMFVGFLFVCLVGWLVVFVCLLLLLLLGFFWGGLFNINNNDCIVKRNLRHFSSPHCATNCLKKVHSSGQSTNVCIMVVPQSRG